MYGVEAFYKCENGDSGGLVYMDVDGAYRIAGIHASGNDITSKFVKADNIVNKMNIYPY